MYFFVVAALTLLLPIGSAVLEHGAPDWLSSLGKWTAFWATGVRLFTAGASQVFRPAFTLKEMFEIDGDAATPVVQELGFANIAMGALGLSALINPMLAFGGALVGGLYYGLAGARHVGDRTHKRNGLRSAALASDLWVFAVLAAFAATRLAAGGF
jgi:hypothetical protein